MDYSINFIDQNLEYVKVSTSFGDDLHVNIPKNNGIPITENQLSDYLQSVVEMEYEHMFFDKIIDKLFLIRGVRYEYICVVNDTVPENGSEKELKYNRLFNIGIIISKDPAKYYGTLFDGKPLPADSNKILKIIESFNEKYLRNSVEIEKIIQHYNSLVDQLSHCETIEDVDKIKKW